MKENLKTTHYADGTSISLGSGSSTSNKYRYYPNGSSSNVSTYGYLYNWAAVMNGKSSSSANPSGVQGPCPNGWHVPSDAEWTQLTNYVSSQSQYLCGSTSTFIAKALSSTTGWTSDSGTCTVGNTQSNNNKTGFNAMPAGAQYDSNSQYFGTYAMFWSSTEASSENAWRRYIGNTLAAVNGGSWGANYYKYNGHSVRCLKD